MQRFKYLACGGKETLIADLHSHSGGIDGMSADYVHRVQ
jgi:hypothetical protein